jgi:uncharacterized protein (DUF1697 family)
MAKKTTPKRPKERAGKRYVALLRAINVGGRTLPMKDLAAMFVKAGCTEVKTYIQSGNVVFTTIPESPRRGTTLGSPRRGKDAAIGDLGETIERAILKRTGFESPVIVRSAEELAAILKNAPYADPGSEKPALHLLFLSSTPSAARVAALDADRSPGDRFTVRGKDVYLLCPNGVGVSKLTTGYFDTKLDTISTGRNFRTIRKLLEMCGQ